ALASLWYSCFGLLWGRAVVLALPVVWGLDGTVGAEGTRGPLPAFGAVVAFLGLLLGWFLFDVLGTRRQGQLALIPQPAGGVDVPAVIPAKEPKAFTLPVLAVD